MSAVTKIGTDHNQAVVDPKRIANAYGTFELSSKEFHLTQILTPRPWSNVMSNGDYGVVISNTGGGYSFLHNGQLNRVTRWEQDLVLEQYGRYLYVYDVDRDAVHSTTYAPVRELAKSESVIYGLGYTTYRREFDDLVTEHTVFVPSEGNCEHWLVTVVNHSSRSKNLRIGGYLEWHLGQQGEQHREFHRLFTSVDTTESALIAWKRRGLDEGTREEPEAPAVAIYGIAGLNSIHWFTDKLHFVGRRADLARPEALVEETKPVSTGRWDDPIAGFTAGLMLAAGESKTFAVTVAQEPDRETALQTCAKATIPTVKARFEATKKKISDRCGSLQIETDSPEFDLMNNGWLPFQAEYGRILARSAYYQQGGAYGYRDQLQDSLMLLDTDPAETLANLIRHAEAMYEDGGVRHWWHPGTKIVAESRHSDTCLWLAFGMLEYLDETADLQALSHECRFLSHETQDFSSTGTLLDHCLRGIRRCLSKQSERGLPLIGAGDWNDGLSHAGIDGKGESVWLAMFAYQIISRFTYVLDRLGEGQIATELRTSAAALKAAVEAHGWDGNYYIAGTSDNGIPFGSHTRPEGSLFLNPQTWAVISDIATKDRSTEAMMAVRDKLVKPYGALLLTPAFRNVDPYVGYITRYAPGLRENGGVYSHASTWAIQAFARVGDRAAAWDLFKAMLPTRGLKNVDEYEAEPFVMPGNVDGPDSPYEGRAGWTWYTGSAAWMRRAAIHWILGVRPTLDGLLLESLIPSELGKSSFVRSFRGDTFSIEIEPGEDHELFVDGKYQESRLVPASGENRKRTIRLVAKK